MANISGGVSGRIATLVGPNQFVDGALYFFTQYTRHDLIYDIFGTLFSVIEADHLLVNSAEITYVPNVDHAFLVRVTLSAIF